MPANIKSIELRNLQIEDYKQLKKHDWILSRNGRIILREDQIILLLKFPEGQLVIVVDGIVVGSALSLLRKILLLKHGPIKLSQEISRSQLTILMEKFYMELTFY
jgi:hypothetical protein